MHQQVFSPEQVYAKALDDFRSGRFSGATQLLEALIANPVLGPDAMNLLAVICAQTGDLPRSLAFLTQLTNAFPLNPDYRSNLVTTLEKAGNMPAAVEAANNWATALYKNKRWDEAEAVLRRLLKIDPSHPLARCNLAATCQALGRPGESIAVALPLLRQCAGSDSVVAQLIDDAERSLGCTDDSREVADPQISGASRSPAGLGEIQRLLPDLLCNLGNSLASLSRVDLSLRAYRRAMDLAPTALTEWNMALVLLLRGDFDAGWRAYEARWRWDEFDFPARNFPQPRWQGEPLKGRSILVYAEQGFGDTIQFCRLVMQLLSQTRSVTFEVQGELFTLLRHSFKSLPVRVMPRTGDPRRLAEPIAFDVHCGLMSLPHLLNIDMDHAASHVPYIEPTESARQRWRQALIPREIRRVGIVWAGRPEHTKDRERSIADLSVLKPLAELAGIEWHSLQLGNEGAKLKSFAANCIDHRADLTQFDDTAALIECLDAVVTVDTAVAHLAGALGKPVYLLLAQVPEWRWRLDLDSSPWYANVRIFRQCRMADWSSPVAALAKALQSSGDRR